jgi:proteic killer suppression protein
MKIRGFVHKGLKRLYEEDSAKGVSAASADKLRKMLAFLDGMDDPAELLALPTWKAHLLTGNRKGTWSLSVTANLRLTFRMEVAKHPAAESAISELNLEDYH